MQYEYLMKYHNTNKLSRNHYKTMWILSKKTKYDYNLQHRYKYKS